MRLKSHVSQDWCQRQSCSRQRERQDVLASKCTINTVPQISAWAGYFLAKANPHGCRTWVTSRQPPALWLYPVAWPSIVRHRHQGGESGSSLWGNWGAPEAHGWAVQVACACGKIRHSFVFWTRKNVWKTCARELLREGGKNPEKQQTTSKV